MKFAIVTQSMAPWVYETSIILGLPRGFRYRARFDQRWVEPKIRARLLRNEEVDGVVCVRDWCSSEVIPLRKIKTKSTSKIGIFFHIEYQICEYIDYNDKPEKNQIQIDRFNSIIRGTFEKNGWSNDANQIMDPLIFEFQNSIHIENFQNDESNIDRFDYNQWLITVGFLKRFQSLHGMPFLKFTLRDLQSRKPLVASAGQFSVDRGSEYVLNVFHYLVEAYKIDGMTDTERTPRTEYMSSGPYLTELVSTSDEIEISPSIRNFSGRYDQIKFYLSLKTNGRKVSDMMLLKFSVPADVAKSFNSIVDIPIKIRTPIKGKIVRGSLVLCVITLVVFSSYSDIFKNAFAEPWKSLIRDFSLVFFTFQAIDLGKTIWEHLRKI